MKHSVSTRKELTILRVEESVFDVRHSDTFRSTIDNLVGNDLSKNVIIDFSQVKAIDSSGIGSMLLAHQLANRSDGLAIFVSLCQQIKDLLKLTNLDKQLYIFSSINEVMTLIEPALKGKRGPKSRQAPIQDDITDELTPDELEILPDEVFTNGSFPEIEEESVVLNDEVEEEIGAKDDSDIDDDIGDNDDNDDDADYDMESEEAKPAVMAKKRASTKQKNDNAQKKRGRPKKKS